MKTGSVATMPTDDIHALKCLALGRILRLSSRPFQEGDIEEYERCRAIIMAESPEPTPDHRPSYARDRMKGAAGD